MPVAGGGVVTPPFDGASQQQDYCGVAGAKDRRSVDPGCLKAADELTSMASTLAARASLLRLPGASPEFVAETLELTRAVRKALDGDADWRMKLAAFCAAEGLDLRLTGRTDVPSKLASQLVRTAGAPRFSKAKLKAVEGLIAAYRDNTGGRGRGALQSVNEAHAQLFGIEPASLRRQRARTSKKPKP